ncbi:unnamed protein product [Urochloa humidicola]
MATEHSFYILHPAASAPGTISQLEIEKRSMAKQHQQKAPLGMVFLAVLLVVSAMHAIPTEAGRVLAGSIGYDPLKPGRTPSGEPEPYTRPCRRIYQCPPETATATP